MLGQRPPPSQPFAWLAHADPPFAPCGKAQASAMRARSVVRNPAFARSDHEGLGQRGRAKLAPCRANESVSVSAWSPSATAIHLAAYSRWRAAIPHVPSPSARTYSRSSLRPNERGKLALTGYAAIAKLITRPVGAIIAQLIVLRGWSSAWMGCRPAPKPASSSTPSPVLLYCHRSRTMPGRADQSSRTPSARDGGGRLAEINS
jgi:hypothetical protein